MKFVRIKQCKFENASSEKPKLIILIKNGCVVKLNRFFLKPHEILDYRQNFISFQNILANTKHHLDTK